jgi:hypothetical protein
MTKPAIKAIAVIIDVKNFPNNCIECAFMAKAQCIPQGDNSTISYKERPCCCPLMTPEAYKVYKEQRQ